MKYLQAFIITTFIIASGSTNGQFLSFLSGEVDTNYIDVLPMTLSTRVYLSRKFTQYEIRDHNIGEKLVYMPNKKLVAGIGFNYGLLGLNVGIGMLFFNQNQDDEKYGETNYLDLQAHWYLRKISIDLMLNRYQGYYLSNPHEMILGWPSDDTLPKRRDMITISTGINVQYLFNYKKFSYNAGFVQTEWQKKSAGSFILGGQFYYVKVRGDSTLIPDDIRYENFFDGFHFRRSDSYSLGANIGYAHTFVIISRIFFSISLTGGASLANVTLLSGENNNSKKSGIKVGFHSTFRTALGYNHKRFYIGFSYVNLPVISQAPVPKGWIRFGTGNLRFNVVYRFPLKKPIKILDPKYW